MSVPAPAGLAVDDEGTGTPVLLVHGQPGTAASWAPVAARLAARYRVLVPDRPGYGRTSLPAGGLEHNAAVLAAELERRRAVPAVVVGHSYGGGIALILAARAPEVVAALVLVGSVGAPGSVNALDRLLALPGAGEVASAAGLLAVPALAGLRRLLGASDATGRLASRLAAALPDDDLVATGGDLVRTARAFGVEQRALLAEAGLLERAVGDVAVPTTVVTGAWDAVVPPSASADLAAGIAGARLVSLAGVGHFVARDVPDTLAEIVDEVASRLGGPDS